MRQSIYCVLLAVFILSPWKAHASAGVTYHGRLIAPSGQPVVSSVVTFKIQIRSPGSENCLLFEENQTKDLSQTGGVFTLNINEDPGMRTDTTGLSFDRIFSNQGTFALTGNCSIGNTYSPTYADNRKIQVYFNDGSFVGWEPMPSQNVNYVPKALDALQVGGFQANHLLRVEDGGVPQSVSSMTSAQFAEMMKLILGTTTQYLKTSSTGASLPSFSSDPSGASAGQMWYDSSGNVIKFFNGSTVQTLGVSGSGISSLTAGTGLTGGTITTSGTIALAAAGTAGTYYKVTTDAYGRVTSGQSSLVEADIPSLSTAGKVSGSAITSGTIGGSTAISTTGSIVTTNDITSKRNILYDHSGAGPGYVGMQAPADMSGVNYTLTLPATAGTAGQVLSTTNASGALAWTNLVATDLSTITGTGIVQRNGANSYSTVNVLSPLNYTGGNLGVNAGSGGVLLDGGNTVTGTLSAGTISNHNVNFKTNNMTRMTIDTSGKVGVGTATPSSMLDIVEAPTFTSATSPYPATASVDQTLSPASDSSASSYAFKAVARTTAGAENFTGTPVAGNFNFIHNGTGAINNATATQGFVENVSTGSLNYGIGGDFWSHNKSSGAVTNAIGVRARAINGTGSITNSYEIYTSTGNSGTITNQYGVYQSTAASKNFFAGNVGIGTTTPLSKLSVSGGTSIGTFAGTTAAPANGLVVSGTILKGQSVGQTGIYNSYTGTYAFGPGLQVSGGAADAASAALMNFQVNAAGPNLVLAHSRAAMGAQGLVDSGDELGVLHFQGSDGTNFLSSSKISSVVTGIPATGDIASELRFATRAPGGTGAAQRMVIDSGGNVGIGVAVPTAKLEVNGTIKATAFSGPIASSSSANSSAYTINSDSDSAGGDGGINLQVRGATKLAVTDGGRVSVGGATTPASLLANTNTNTTDAAGTGSGVDSLTWLTNAAGYVATFTNTSSATNANGVSVKITGTAATNRILNLNANGADVLTVTGQGNVGIGTTNPRGKLNVYGTGQTTANIDTNGDLNNMLTLQSSNISPGDGGGILFGTRTVGGATDGLWAGIKAVSVSGSNNSAGDLAISTRTVNTDATLTEKMRIMANGNVGIGTTNPRSSLEVNGGVRSVAGAPANDSANTGYSFGANGDTGMFLINNTGPADGDIAFYSNANPKATILGNGNMGVGTTNPLATLHAASVTTHAGLRVDGASGFNSFVDFSEAGTVKANMFWDGANDRFIINNYGVGNTILNPTSGNVAIGKLVPAQKLDVLGSARFGGIDFQDPSGTQYPDAWMGASTNVEAGLNKWFHVGGITDNTDGTGAKRRIVLASDITHFTGSVGIGTTAPKALLSLAGSSTHSFGVSNKLQIVSNSTDTTPALFIDSGNTSQANGSGLYVYQRASSSGTADLVHIGARFTSGFNLLNVTSGELADGTGGTSRMVVQASGNVGIGTTSPQASLDIGAGGALRVTQPLTSPTGSYVQLGAPQGSPGITIQRGDGAGGEQKAWQLRTESDGSFNVQEKNVGLTTGSSRFWISLGGSTGIGTTSPSERLHVVGNLRVQGTTDCTLGNGSGGTNCSSDIRLKTNIQEIENPLEKILSLRGVEFDWNERSQSPGAHAIGVIAQDVEKQFPTAVIEDSNTGYKKVDYAVLIAPVIQALKELNKRIGDLFSASEAHSIDIASLKAENVQLRIRANMVEADAAKQKLENEAKIKALEQKFENLEKMLDSK